MKQIYTKLAYLLEQEQNQSSILLAAEKDIMRLIEASN